MSCEVSKQEIVEGLFRVGVKAGDVLLVHSAMRTLGRIEGGAEAVVQALLEVLGEGGTLVVPAFTFAHEAESEPTIRPAADPSEMGMLTEAARTHPEARRSVAYRHSFAAIGPWAEVVTDVDPFLSPFDLRSSFGVMLGLDTQVVLFGVTYSSSTSHHFAEYVCGVPYRHCIQRQVHVERADGERSLQTMTDYQPKSEGGSYYGNFGPNFNRLGKMLEDRGRVGTTFIGNSAVRRLAMRELVDLARVEAAKDYNVFRTAEGCQDQLTQLQFGQTVVSPVLIDGAGRSHTVQWCVKDPSNLSLPE